MMKEQRTKHVQEVESRPFGKGENIVDQLFALRENRMGVTFLVLF